MTRTLSFFRKRYPSLAVETALENLPVWDDAYTIDRAGAHGLRVPDNGLRIVLYNNGMLDEHEWYFETGRYSSPVPLLFSKEPTVVFALMDGNGAPHAGLEAAVRDDVLDVVTVHGVRHLSGEVHSVLHHGRFRNLLLEAAEYWASALCRSVIRDPARNEYFWEPIAPGRDPDRVRQHWRASIETMARIGGYAPMPSGWFVDWEKPL